MTAIELNADIYRSLSEIALDEALLRKAARALRRIAKQCRPTDDTAMTEEELQSKIQRGLEQYQNGEYYEMLPDETLEDFIKRVG